MGAPGEWVISRVCEEFNCLPAAAIEAIDDDIGGLLFKIIGLRSYKKAKEQFDEGQKEPDLTKRPSGPLFDKVREIEWELNKEKLKRKQRSNAT